MNTEDQKQELSSYEQYELELEKVRIERALTAKYADEEHVQARLEQINETIRHYPEDTVQQRWPDLKKERDNFLASAGELDPWLFLEQMGFKVAKLQSGMSATFDYEGKQLVLSNGYHTKDKITISHRENPRGDATYEHVEFPKTVDGVYRLIGKYRPPIYVGAKHMANYEKNYVKQLKSKKK